MYRIIGADGKEYGPFDLQQMRQWISQGRVNSQTRVQGPGSAEWNLAANFPELGLLGVAASSSTPSSPASQPATQQKGLAITSLVLGILSLAGLCALTGIPAIICGHMAQGRARRSPAQYGGAGLALAGTILGYISLFVTLVSLVLAAMLLPALAKAKSKAQRIGCVNNMKQIGLAARTWAIDNDGNFPFNLSTNKGGTLELCLPGSDGFDRNAVYHFRVMSNELSTPKILVCPDDPKKQPALDFSSLGAANVTYQMRSGPDVSETNPDQVLAVCPIHNNVLYCDGSVRSERKTRQ